MGISEYYTVLGSSEGYYKDKSSKFIALAYHVESEEEAKDVITSVKKKYYDARHHCYAFRINPEKEFSRSSDDGEPSGTAGKPILNQLLSHELYNVIVIVVRYFGGTKLGVSGLILAYKSSTLNALQNSKIVKKFITSPVELCFQYPLMNEVMRVIKEENIKIINQDFTSDCKIFVEIKKKSKKNTLEKFKKIRGVKTT
ncbi:MAG: YigZ family protein [Bacteroidetes bacterium]|nr:YigZ family protein [Bacteroidota bacterium]MBL6942912.1 YigZ family protein [Bacteroidales bacterium]